MDRMYILLNDLVRCPLRSSSDDVAGSRGLLDGEGVFANILPPDILDGAWAHAVNTLALFRADDDILQGSARLDQEDSIGVTSFGLAAATVFMQC